MLFPQILVPTAIRRSNLKCYGRKLRRTCFHSIADVVSVFVSFVLFVVNPFGIQLVQAKNWKSLPLGTIRHLDIHNL